MHATDTSMSSMSSMRETSATNETDLALNLNGDLISSSATEVHDKSHRDTGNKEADVYEDALDLMNSVQENEYTAMDRIFRFILAGSVACDSIPEELDESIDSTSGPSAPSEFKFERAPMGLLSPARLTPLRSICPDRKNRFK